MYNRVMKGCGYLAAVLFVAYASVRTVTAIDGPAGVELADWIGTVMLTALAMCALVSIGAWLVRDVVSRSNEQLRRAVVADVEKMIATEITAQLVRIDPSSRASLVREIRMAVREDIDGALRLTADKAVRYGMVARATAPVPNQQNGTNILPFARED